MMSTVKKSTPYALVSTSTLSQTPLPGKQVAEGKVRIVKGKVDDGFKVSVTVKAIVGQPLYVYPNMS